MSNPSTTAAGAADRPRLPPAPSVAAPAAVPDKGPGGWWDRACAGLTLGQGLARRADNFLLLRIVAAALVIYGHTSHLAPAVEAKDLFVRMGWHIYSGDIAVDAFFLISGFLVTGSWLRKRSLWEFGKARALRLMPAYLVALVLLALVYGPIFTTLPLGDYFSEPKVWAFITTNARLKIDMVWHLPGVFAEGMKAQAIDGSFWTLPAEARMYVWLGLLAATGVLAVRPLALATFAVLIGVGLLYPKWIPLPPSFLRLGEYFALGALLYIGRDQVRLSLPVVFALVMLAVLTNHTPLYKATFPMALAAVVFGVAYLTPPLPALDRLGDPSYGIYLWGWPMQQAVAYVVPAAGLLLHDAMAISLAVLAGYASWRLVERPALRWKAPAIRRPVIDAPGPP